MTRGRITLLVAIVSAGLVLVLAAALTERRSPGPISAVHAAVADLEGGKACAACHGGWFGDMQSACNKCHQDVAAEQKDKHGLHGIAAVEVAGVCSTCHGEHHGAEFRLVNRLAFAQAGVADPDKFQHRLVGFDMAGAHLELACTKCHKSADKEQLADGEHRYLGLTQECKSCHEDVHKGAMKFACTACHDQTDFKVAVAVGHDRWLPLTGPHADVQCRQCHAFDQPSALERLRPDSLDHARQCGDCHATPHRDSFVAGNATAAKTTPAGVCVVCHAMTSMTFTDPATTVTVAQHTKGGFPLTAPHDQVKCASCHATNVGYAERHPGRNADDCAACHQDPHGGQFDEGPFAAAGCLGCHDRTQFKPHAFDLKHHQKADMRLDGKHAELACSKCHQDPDAGLPRHFRGTPSRCEQCHDDAHRGAFVADAAALQARPGGTCAECHRTSVWNEIDAARFDHARWTHFALDGAHALVECKDCHADTGTKDEFGRRFGRVPEPATGAASCTSCHHDPHAGDFDTGKAPREVEGRTGCVRCHDTTSFRALPKAFDHELFTGFVLTGKHGEQACTACHERLLTPAADGRTWARARGNDCVDCHRDPHLHQFDRLGRTDCVRCHKSTMTFATLSFRHNLDSRFNLGEQHAKVACNLCHKPETVEGQQVIRYKPLPTDCVSCHGRAEGGAGGRRRGQ